MTSKGFLQAKVTVDPDELRVANALSDYVSSDKYDSPEAVAARADALERDRIRKATARDLEEAERPARMAAALARQREREAREAEWEAAQNAKWAHLVGRTVTAVRVGYAGSMELTFADAERLYIYSGEDGDPVQMLPPLPVAAE